MAQAYLHRDNMENVRERLENFVTNSSVDTMYDGEYCFITVTQRNETTGNERTWSFCVDFGDWRVTMLEPTEDMEYFGNDNEIFEIIKSFLQGGMSRKKRRNKPDYNPGEPIKVTGFGNKIGSSKKPIKSSLSDVNKALGFTDNDVEEDGRIHITTDLGEFVVDYVNDEYIINYDGKERTFTDYKDTVEEVVELFNQLCNEEVKLFNTNITSSKKPSKSLPTEKDYQDFVNQLNKYVAENYEVHGNYGPIYVFDMYKDEGTNSDGYGHEYPNFIIYDDEGNLDMHSDDDITEYIKNELKAKGWYPEAVHSSSDFTIAVM